MKPDFIGIGVQKAGTTWIYQILMEHPDVHVAYGDEEKDIRFFSHFYDYGYQWYESHFAHSAGAKVVGEYSTSYFYNMAAPEYIRDYRSDVKLIVCLRNPIDRAMSNHRHEVRLGHVSGENTVFENGLNNNPTYIYQSLYFTHLSRWLRYFDRDQILVLIFEDLVRDPGSFARHVYEFLDVDPAYSPALLGQSVNKSRIPRSRSAEMKIRQASHLMRKLKMGYVLDMAKSIGVKEALWRANAQKGAVALMEMRPETRNILSQRFQEENEKLAELLGRDLSFWQ